MRACRRTFTGEGARVDALDVLLAQVAHVAAGGDGAPHGEVVVAGLRLVVGLVVRGLGVGLLLRSDRAMRFLSWATWDALRMMNRLQPSIMMVRCVAFSVPGRPEGGERIRPDVLELASQMLAAARRASLGQDPRRGSCESYVDWPGLLALA